MIGVLKLVHCLSSPSVESFGLMMGQQKQTEVINYSSCCIGHTGGGRVYKCKAILLGPTERAVYEVWYNFYFGGEGGKSSCEMTHKLSGM